MGMIWECMCVYSMMVFCSLRAHHHFSNISIFVHSFSQTFSFSFHPSLKASFAHHITFILDRIWEFERKLCVGLTPEIFFVLLQSQPKYVYIAHVYMRRWRHQHFIPRNANFFAKIIKIQGKCEFAWFLSSLLIFFFSSTKSMQLIFSCYRHNIVFFFVIRPLSYSLDPSRHIFSFFSRGDDTQDVNIDENKVLRVWENVWKNSFP